MSDFTPLTETQIAGFREYAKRNLAESDGSKCQWADLTIRAMDEIVALRAELAAVRAVPEGHVRLPSGRDVKVLGTLPMTGDGVIVGIDAFLWMMPPHCANPTGFGFRVLSTDEFGNGGKGWKHCYSNYDAALSAKGAPQ